MLTTQEIKNLLLKSSTFSMTLKKRTSYAGISKIITVNSDNLKLKFIQGDDSLVEVMSLNGIVVGKISLSDLNPILDERLEKQKQNKISQLKALAQS